MIASLPRMSLLCLLVMHAGLDSARATTIDSGADTSVNDLTGNMDRAVQCMALAIAYEAGFEPLTGQQAVAEVILNRTRHPAYPKSVCGVVFQGSSRRTGCQFTFTCDGALKRPLSRQLMENTRGIAQSVLSGTSPSQVGGATHYHADYVSPYWAPSLIRITKIGAHIFYRAPNSVDAPARYSATAEPAIGALGAWATAPDALTQRGRAALPAVPAPAQIPINSAAPAFAPWGLVINRN